MYSDYNNLNTSYMPNSYNHRFPMPNNFPNPIQSVSPNKPFETYDIHNNLTGYFWYEGNTLDLTWDIEGVALTSDPSIYIDAAQYIEGCELVCKVYNFRREVVIKASSLAGIYSEAYPLDLRIQKSDDPQINHSISCTLHVDRELSAKLSKGVYSITLTAIHPSGLDETLFDGTNCKFEVR